MIEAAQIRKWSVATYLVSATLITCVVAGCGNNGQTDLSTQPGSDSPAAISGVVLAPNGEYARAGGVWDWANALLLTPRAAALQNVAPAQGTLRVALSQVNQGDAADGSIDSPLLINQNDTDGEGAYRIVDPIATHVDTCRLMVSVGSGGDMTRAFVIAKTTNIDASSEAVVRVILNRLTRAPAVTLCDFSLDAIARISSAVGRAAYLASGDTVAAINDDAFTRACTAAASAEVKQAIDNATGRPSSTGCGTAFP